MSAATEVYAHTSAYMVDIVEGHNTLLKVLFEDELLAKFLYRPLGLFPGHRAQQGPDTSPRDAGQPMLFVACHQGLDKRYMMSTQ